MTLTKQFVQDIFSNLESSHQDMFFSQVADNVVWHVMGTHPLAGIYHGKNEFIAHTFKRLHEMLKGGPVLKVHNVFLDGSVAIVEMSQVSSSIAGKPFNNTYCWIVRFENNIIVEVRAYLDSALVQELVLETYNL